ncbi:replication endonuclease [Mannheimia glucosida]|uniref:replication endonuclease n=1 Tax=Mannheimia glucosida TaxID=85401 RepID=UPI0039185F98
MNREQLNLAIDSEQSYKSVNSTAHGLSVKGWDYEAREKEVDEQRAKNVAELIELRKPRKIQPLALADIDPQSTPLQQELFSAIPKDHYYFVESLIQKLPTKRQKEHFRGLYLKELKSVKDDGSVAFRSGLKQITHANNFIRELVQDRLGLVFKQYRIDLTYLSKSLSDKWAWAKEYYTSQGEYFNYSIEISKEHDKAELLADKERYLPFYLIPNSKLESLAEDVANIFQQIQVSHFTALAESGREFSDSDLVKVLDEIYQKCGHLCESIGFPYYYWESYLNQIEKGKKPSQKAMETALNKVVCRKHWARTFNKIQAQLLEHLRIACGEVNAKSPYVSKEHFSFYSGKQAEALRFLKNSILVNVDNQEEQIELFDMWFRSNSNPIKRRYEMMTQLRGIEEWAEENNYQALFLTLTAPSSFHAQHSKHGRNKNWKGASPKQTHNYLNKVWQEFRALLAKRKIDQKGMRVAEPHQDATPHWHLLSYVPQEQVEEFIELFKQKALELDGDEKGAAEHRCKVELCDKTKGSATAYIAKYIAKNIDGFDEDGLTSDEAPEMDFKANSRKVKAWASLWGIRQFQFYGVGSISVWRELRRCTIGNFESDKFMEDLFIYADNAEYACFMDKQAKGNIRQAPVKLYYEDTEENKYGVINKKIKGIFNQFKQVVSDGVQFVATRMKSYRIERKSKAVNRATSEQEQAQTNTGHSPAWTCVNNCNPRNSKGSGGETSQQVVIFLRNHREELERLNNALILQGIPQRFITDYRKMSLIKGGEIQLYGNARIKFNGCEIVFTQ